MQKAILIISVLTVLYSCEKSPEEKEVEVDFSFGYIEGQLTANDGSSDVPDGSSYTWVLNGKEKGSSQNLVSSIDSDGHYAISLCIETPNGIETCKAKEFQIANSILVPYNYIDTTRNGADKDPLIDFSFGYSAGTITANDGSSSVPDGSSYTWVLNGSKESSNQNLTSYINSDGHYAISLCIEMPNGTESCKAKEFQILNDMLVPYDYIDTTKNSAEKEPVIDFSYSVLYRSDSTEVEIGMTDASTTYFDGDHSYKWYLNGQRLYNLNGATGKASEDLNGYYSITLVIEFDGLTYSVSKEFEVTGIKD